MKKIVKNILLWSFIGVVHVSFLCASFTPGGGTSSSVIGTLPSPTGGGLGSTKIAASPSGSSSISSALPVAPSNYGFESHDWRNLIMPVMEVYANSNLSCWYSGGKNTPLPDSELSKIFEVSVSAAAQSPNKRTDVIPVSIFTNSKPEQEFAISDFLKNQSNPYTGMGWDTLVEWEAGSGLKNIIKSGFCNTAAQYMSAIIENFAGRAATSVSVFQKGNFFPESSDQAVVSSFYNQAVELFQKARYSRLMYQFPVNLTGQINQLTAISASATGTPAVGQPPFILPNNAADLNNITNNNFAFTAENNSITGTTSTFLNPLYAFCGIIVISQDSRNLVQVNGNFDSAILSHPDHLVPKSSTTPAVPYAPVFFLPAVFGTVNNLVYNAYAPVDESANAYSSSTSGGISLVNREVSFSAAQINVGGIFVGKTVISCTVSSQVLPEHEHDPLGIYFSFTTASSQSNSSGNGGGPSVTQYGVTFNSTDLANFFISPTQWAIVMKEDQGAFNVLGLVKLNPYDFPLNFTTSSMNTVLGISAEPLVATSQNADGIAVQSSTPASFSQKDVWDGAYKLYKNAFPENYHKEVLNYSTGLLSYSFSYMILQGLLNGYLMSNTYSAFFNVDTWPNATTVSPEYATYYGNAMSPTSVYLDQVFPTPLLSDWLGVNSPLDWFYLRVLLSIRSVIQSLYCPYDALVVPPSQAFTSVEGKWLNIVEVLVSQYKDASVSMLQAKQLEVTAQLGRTAYLLTFNSLADMKTALPLLAKYNSGFSVSQYKKNSGAFQILVESQIASVLEYIFMYPEQDILLSLPTNSHPNSREIVGQNYVSGTSTASNSYQWILPTVGMVPCTPPGAKS